MPATNVVQVSAYIDPALKRLLIKTIKKLNGRMSVSSYIERMLFERLLPGSKKP